MGYTIATPIRDEESKACMLAFLEKNFRHWSEVAVGHEPKERYYGGPYPDGELDYDRGACRIGFNFHTSGYDREYIFTVCRWMALKVGRVDTFPTKYRPALTGRFPVIVYDGDEGFEDGSGDGAWPVILVEPRSDIAEEYVWCAVDRWGCLDLTAKNHADRVLRRECQMVQDYGYDGRACIRQEMRKLDELWKREVS